MPRKRRGVQELPTIWRVPDDLWALIAPILMGHDPPKRTGRPRIDARDALDAVIYRMRSGVQRNHLPKDFPDDSSVHRTSQRWVTLGIFDRIWAAVVERCDELGGVDWEWQAADGMMGKARLGGPDRPQPHRSRQAGHQEEPAGRSGRRAAGRRGGRRQRP